MNILEIKQLKQRVEQDIERILKSFEEQSGCFVDDIK